MVMAETGATGVSQIGGQPNTARTSTPTEIDPTSTSSPKPRGLRRPNYALIHARKLPLDVYPLPTFQPHNPLSLLPILYTLIKDFILPRSSHARCPYQAKFSSNTRSVHVTDHATARALWEAGFFGKGILSRSEPNWLESEKTRVGLQGRQTAEQFTGSRRKDREEFKRERARIEKELVAEVREREKSGLKGLPGGEAADQIPVLAGTRARELMDERAAAKKQLLKSPTAVPEASVQPIADANIDITNQEHLQLSLEEAFFLHYALGALNITNMSTPNEALVKADAPPTSWDILDLFRRHANFPPLSSTSPLQPDDPFLLSYTTYHHFRSLGWVVRPGLKFAVDFLLYERGVVFSHAAFAVLILPTYSDPYWFATSERKAKVEKDRKKRSWHWFHAMNRVQNQVLKTLVVAYVDVPKPWEGGEDVGRLLRGYRIREFCVKRWSANRNRE